MKWHGLIVPCDMKVIMLVVTDIFIEIDLLMKYIVLGSDNQHFQLFCHFSKHLNKMNGKMLEKPFQTIGTTLMNLTYTNNQFNELNYDSS